jgi:hypothetical protein
VIGGIVYGCGSGGLTYAANAVAGASRGSHPPADAPDRERPAESTILQAPRRTLARSTQRR